MRVLLFGNFYAPEETGIAPYTTGFAERLVARGHVVTVVTGMPSYPQWRIYPEYEGMLRKQEFRGGVDVRRVRGYIPRKQSTVHRALYEASFLLGGATTLPMAQPDVVFGVVPALGGGVLARVAARRFKTPYGLVFQDLTGPASSQSGIISNGRTAGLISAAEGWVARGAAALGIIAEGFRPYLESLGVNPARIHRVRNWTHVGEPTLDRSTTRKRLDLPLDAIVCLHAGNMGYKQGLTNVVECARLATEANPRLLFVLMGDGNQRQLLVDLAQLYRLRNLRFLPIQPAELFPSVLAAVDILLVNQRASVTNMSLPGKLTSYLASGRPVVAAVSSHSEVARELRYNGMAVLVPPDRPEALLATVRDLAADRARTKRLAAAGRRYASTTLTPNAALAGLEALVEAAAANQGTRRLVTRRSHAS
jgi:colanic acid biosynthesis glycosyl transferase WcaI